MVLVMTGEYGKPSVFDSRVTRYLCAFNLLGTQSEATANLAFCVFETKR